MPVGAGRVWGMHGDWAPSVGEELAGDTSPEAELAVCPLHAHLSVKKVAYRNQFGVP